MTKEKNYLHLNDDLYGGIKWAVSIVLPALATLYATLGYIWGFPAVEQILGTLVALELFLGVVLGFSNHNYYKSEDRFDGAIEVDEDDESISYSVVPYNNAYDWAGREELNLKIRDLR